MNVMDGLLAIAQIAATFAGFTALMSLVRRGAGARELAVANFRIMMLMVQSMITLFLCLLPLLLFQLGLAGETVWTAANIILWISVVARIAVVTKRIRAVVAVHPDIVNPWSTAVNFGVSALVVIAVPVALLLSNGLVAPNAALAGEVPVALVASYFFGCLAMLLIAAVAFILLVDSLLPTAEEE